MVNGNVFRELVSRFNDPEYCDIVVMADDGEIFYASKFAMRCGSEVFHRMFSIDMIESVSGTVHIRDAESGAVEQMLVLLHGGECDIKDDNFLHLLSLAERYQVRQLLHVCDEFERERFRVDQLNCCMILEQSYCLQETPVDIRQKCEDMVRQKAVEIVADPLFRVDFLSLSFHALKGVVENALPSMFADESFPSSYVRLGEAVLLWLESQQQEGKDCKRYALDLMGLLEFESLGLNGIASLVATRRLVSEDKSWVRAFPTLGFKVLDAMRVAQVEAKHIISSQDWTPPYSGKYTIVCKNPWDRHVSVSTFDLSTENSLLIRIRTDACAVFCRCSTLKIAFHALVVENRKNSVRRIYGNGDSLCFPDDDIHSWRLVPQSFPCSCKFSGTGHDEDIKQWGSDPFASSGWINPKRLEAFQTTTRCLSESVSIFLRPEDMRMSDEKELKEMKFSTRKRTVRTL